MYGALIRTRQRSFECTIPDPYDLPLPKIGSWHDDSAMAERALYGG